MTDDQFRELASGNMADDNPSGIGMTIAQHVARELARSLLHPEPLPPLSIYSIEAELQELLEAREDAEAEGALPEELAVIDERVKQYALAHVRKVDSTAVALRACRGFEEECNQEANRLERAAKRHRARYERIKNAVMWAMAQLGVTKLSTPQNTLRVQGNGGLEPLEVYDEQEIPVAFRKATVTMSLRLLRSICKDLSEVECREIYGTVTSTDNEAIRAELKKRVPCPECVGADLTKPGMILLNPCPRCNGVGTVPASVPGARLLPRGMQLRVE